MVRIRNCLLTAEISGGRWKSAPVNVSKARASWASPPGSLSCNRMTQTYSFPAPCCDLTKRVARSRHTIKQPVTLGSSVPLWPVFSILLLLVDACRVQRSNSTLPEHPLHPSYNLMTGRIRGFVEVYDAGGNVGFEVALERGATARDWNEVAGSDED